MINILIRQCRRHEKFIYRDLLFASANYIFYTILIRYNKIFDRVLTIYQRILNRFDKYKKLDLFEINFN